ncbi:MAG: hypothetical protein KF851_04580 [Pirellulaceae bacterium]|nr:hypothetical protein [Pirellulaceae bacterium]
MTRRAIKMAGNSGVSNDFHREDLMTEGTGARLVVFYQTAYRSKHQTCRSAQLSVWVRRKGRFVFGYF